MGICCKAGVNLSIPLLLLFIIVIIYYCYYLLLLLHSRLQTPTERANCQKLKGPSREDSPVVILRSKSELGDNPVQLTIGAPFKAIGLMEFTESAVVKMLTLAYIYLYV